MYEQVAEAWRDLALTADQLIDILRALDEAVDTADDLNDRPKYPVVKKILRKYPEPYRRIHPTARSRC